MSTTPTLRAILEYPFGMFMKRTWTVGQTTMQSPFIMLGITVSASDIQISGSSSDSFIIIEGVGSSLKMVTAMTNAAVSFQGRLRIKAIALASVGVGIGGITSPYIAVMLEEKYGVRGAFLVLSGIILNTIPVSYSLTLFQTPIITKQDKDKTGKNQKPPGYLRAGHILLDLFKNKHYLMGTICISFGAAVLCAPMFLMVDVGMSRGFSKEDGVFALFILNLVSIPGRLMCGLVEQLPHTSAFLVPLLSFVFGGISILLIRTTTTLAMMIGLASVLGLTIGASISSIYDTAVKVVTSEAYSIAVGVAMTVAGCTVIALPPITGYMKDTTDSYDVIFLVLGLIVLSCALVLVVLCIMRVCQSRRQEEQLEAEPLKTLSSIRKLSII
ncbi:hypothetical protein ScPMuIL_002804 [Solemya velum]